MKKLILGAALLAPIAACAPMDTSGIQPVVSEYNGDSVSIQINGVAALGDEATKNAQKERMQLLATQICQKGHSKRAEYVSQRAVGEVSALGTPSYYERLYLCLR